MTWIPAPARLSRSDTRGARAGKDASLVQLRLQDYPPVLSVHRGATGAVQPRSDRDSFLCLVDPAPHLPARAAGLRKGVSASTAIHGLAALVLVAGIGLSLQQSPASTVVTPVADSTDLPRLVFLVSPGPGGGGGGGGGRSPSPPSRAEAVGRDRMTLPVAAPRSPEATRAPATLPAPVLDARPIASGTQLLLGMPAAPTGLAASTGPGSGGGVGDGSGTGIGSGTGPGLGPGSGGGFGGGAYRLGSGVEPPTVLKQVRPSYTTDALVRRVEGTVVLDVVVGADGMPKEIQMARSLDPGGLDAEAINAVREWRFSPGRFRGTPVDVLVSIILDFRIR